MREIVLDTETTGLDPKQGHRIVEIGAVELFNKVQTGRRYHVYIDPERDMPEEAFRVHGLSDDFLSGKPKFAEVADAFATFIADAPLVIHNAEFDIRFLDHELAAVGRPVLGMRRAVDTLQIARRKHAGAPASLDALCARYGIDTSRRVLHGALLDAQLLADVYLELSGGSQSVFELPAAQSAASANVRIWAARPTPLVSPVTAVEAQAHADLVASIGDKAIWHRYARVLVDA